jgi:nucleoside-diphosphate-sugar epimerase
MPSDLTSTPSTLHVVFGHGPLGRATTRALLATGARVRVVATRPQRPAGLPPAVEYTPADATDPASATRAVAGASHVYNCTNARDYHRWPEQFPPLQRGVLAAARAAGAVLVVVENLYVYGPHLGVPMTEELPLCAVGPRGGTRVAMTRELEAAHASGDVRVVRLRASDLIGPGVGESMAGHRLFEPILRGDTSLRLFADPDLPHSFTAADDVGRALVLAATEPRAWGGVFHVPSAPAITPRALVALIAAEAGVSAPHVSAVPRAWLPLVLPVLGVFVPPLRGISESTHMFYEPFVVDTHRFDRTFDLAPTPLAHSVRAAIAAYRHAPVALGAA